jgi:uncharacterized membrane protein
VVDAALLATDILETTVYLASVPLLWLFLFLWAFDPRSRAGAVGFGHRTFWLLLPGAFVGELASLPFFGWQGNVLAVNVGGGLIPILLSVWLLGRQLGDRGRLWAWFLVAYSVECYAMLSSVFVLADGPGLDLLLGAIAVATVVIVATLARWSSDPVGRRTVAIVSVLLALTSLALVPTFVSTATIPGLGIVSTFPEYLLPPIAVGAASVFVAPRLGLTRFGALPIAYATETLGVLIGADLLREPPLYGASSGAIYAIGGAGTGDLLYLSGLVALATAFGLAELLRRGRPDAALDARPTPDAEARTPTAHLRSALTAAIEGRGYDSLQDAHQATEGAFAQARDLLAPWTPPGHDPFGPRETPPWVVADRANLGRLADSGASHPVDASRGWMTARWLVRYAQSVGRRAFGTSLARSLAFVIDLAVLTTPAALALWFLIVIGPASSEALLTTVPVNAVILAYPALGLLYFVLLEGLVGTTLGKAVVRLSVTARDRSLPGPMSALVRNLPKVVPLTVIAVFLLFLLILVDRGNLLAVSTPGGLEFSSGAVLVLSVILALGVGVPGAASVLSIEATPERQRLGDLWAGTWVLRTAPRPSGAAQAGAAPVPSG